MNLGTIILEMALVLFASWTAAYHLCLLLNLPALFALVAFVLATCICAILLRKSWLLAWRVSSVNTADFFAFLFVALIPGTINLFALNSNPDDFNFLHRALYQIGRLTEPFSTNDTALNISGMPPLSASHLLSSYEPLVALASFAINADPLFVYHNVVPFVVGGIWATSFFCLYRLVGVPSRLALLAILASYAFCILDIEVPGRSYGNPFIYLWVGKAILWAALIPLTLFLAIRLLASPSVRNAILLGLTSIAGVGMSGSGIFSVPLLIWLTATAFILTNHATYKNFSCALLLSFTPIYGVLLGGSIVIGIIPEPSDTTVWGLGFPKDWIKNLELVVSKPLEWVRNILLAFLLPILTIHQPHNRLVAALPLAFVIWFANPLAGPIWLQLLHPGAYWRLLFLIPLPFLAGLVVPGLFQHRQRGILSSLARGTSGVALILILITPFVIGTGYQAFTNIGLKKPAECKFPPRQLAFAESIGSELQNRNLLGPEELTNVLALLDTSLRLEVARGSMHVFSNAGMSYEGRRRRDALRLVTTCKRSPARERALMDSVEMGVDAIILDNCDLDATNAIKDFLGTFALKWRSLESQGYIAFFKQPKPGG